LKNLLLVAVLAIVSVIVGCGDASLPYLTSIAVLPANPSVAAGLTQQFTATGTFSNKSTEDLTSLATWSSSNLPVATITQGVVAGNAATGGGLATTYIVGTSTITASFTTPNGVITGSTTLNVISPDLVSIVVTDSSSVVPGPNSVAAQIAKGTHHQFFAYGVYTDGGERLLPNALNTVSWSSAPVTAATISNVGLALGVSAVGSPATITAASTDAEGNPVSGSATLNVTNATISSVVVSPQVQTIAPLTRLQFAALGEFSDGTTQDITGDVNWTSTNTAAATVSNSAPKGIATGVAAGSATISAALGAATGSSSLTVSSATPVSITLTPATSDVAIGSYLSLHAVGKFSDGSTQPINLATAWSVTPSNGSIATVDQTGVVTGVATGTATVMAKIGAVTATASLSVQSPTAIAITPTAPSIALGTQTHLVATATFADATTQDVSSSVMWVSTAPAVATISDALGSAGWASGITAGTAIIGAGLDGQSAAVQLTVTDATLTTIAISLPAAPANIALGTTQQYQATGTFSDSSTQDLSNQVTWTSSDQAVAVINGSGLATSTGTGTTTIKAAGNIDGTAANATQVLTVY
jgi:hypothetical protein